MRKYIITFTVPNAVVDMELSADEDLKALKEGSLSVFDLISLVENDDASISYSVVEVEEN